MFTSIKPECDFGSAIRSSAATINSYFISKKCDEKFLRNLVCVRPFETEIELDRIFFGKKKIEHVNHILFKKIRKNVKKKKTKSVTHFYHRIILRIITESKNMITDYRISTRDIDSIVYLSGRIKTSVPYFWKKFALIQFLFAYNQAKLGHQESRTVQIQDRSNSGPSRRWWSNGAPSLKFNHTRKKILWSIFVLSLNIFDPEFWVLSPWTLLNMTN